MFLQEHGKSNKYTLNIDIMIYKKGNTTKET